MTSPIETFEANLDAVYQLMRFDQLVLDLPIQQLERVAERQKKHKLAPQLTVGTALQLLKNVRENDSLRSYYELMFNQCLVLAVSHFGSAVRALFVQSVKQALSEGATPELLDEQVRVSVRELRESQEGMSDFVGEYLADRKDLSFQDMQSITRAFGQYLGFTPRRDAMTNDVIVGQACRHAIVHNGGIVDRRLLKQVEAAVPRNVKGLLFIGEALQFNPEEVHGVGQAMTSYLSNLAIGVEAARESTPSETP